jgi:hypothetical protein
MGIGTHVQSLGSGNKNLKTRELAALGRFAKPLTWKMKPWRGTHSSTCSSFALMPQNLVPI